MIKRCALLLAVALVTIGIHSAHAKVVDVAASGFTIKHNVEVNKSPAEAYAIFTGKIALWWDSEHTYSGKSENLSIDLRPNGCFCEKLENQGFVVHMTVINAQAGKLLRMTGGLGPLQGIAGTGVMTVEFKGEGQRTTVNFTYTLGGYSPGGFDKLAPLVDQVMVQQMSRYERFVTTGKL
jgi:hypothetical protein